MNPIYQRLYNSRWFTFRARFLHTHDQCIRCSQPATIVDHIQPHRGDKEVFWRDGNHQALCKHCHDTWKNKLDRIKFNLENGGKIKGATVEGVPIDPQHHWNKKRS